MISSSLWPNVSLKRLFRVINGSTPKADVAEYWNGEIEWATPDDLGALEGGMVLEKTKRRITTQGYLSCGTAMAPKGSIILSTRAPIGHLAIAGTGMCTNQGCRALAPRAQMDSRYFYYSLFALRPTLQALGNGSTFQELSTPALAQLKVPSPPLATQHAIADFLDRQTAKIDDLISGQGRLMTLLADELESFRFDLVTGAGITTKKDSALPWCGYIPAHWKLRRIVTIATMDSGHTPDRTVPEYWDGAIPWVSLNDTAQLRRVDYIRETTKRVSHEGLANSSAHLLPAGTVVFSRDATIGCCGILAEPMAVSQHFIAWLCGSGLRPEFLLLALRAMGRELQRLSMGATIPTIGMPDVRALAMPLPPVSEQDQIIKRFNDERMRIENTAARAGRLLGLLQEFRSSLITAAVTGQIDVSQLGPDRVGDRKIS